MAEELAREALRQLAEQWRDKAALEAELRLAGWVPAMDTLIQCARDLEELIATHDEIALGGRVGE